MVKLGPKFFVNDISFTQDGNFVAIGFANSMIKIYTVENLKETHSYRNHTLPVRKVQWHPNSDSLQLISSDEDKNIVVFDYILNKVIGQIKNAGKNFALTTRGTSIVSSCDQEIKVFEYKTLKLQFTIETTEYVDCMLCL
jgi:WD40 repeat protein